MAWEFVKNEWKTLTGAPATFVISGGFLAFAAWLVTSWTYDRQIDTLNTMLRQKDDLIAQQADAAITTQEIIDELNSAIHDLSETKQRVYEIERRLDEDQKQAISKELSTHPSSVIIETPANPPPVTQDVIEILKSSGWSVTPVVVPTITSDFSIASDDPLAAQTLGRALEDAGLDVQTGVGSSGTTEFLFGGSRP